MWLGTFDRGERFDSIIDRGHNAQVRPLFALVVVVVAASGGCPPAASPCASDDECAGGTCRAGSCVIRDVVDVTDDTASDDAGAVDDDAGAHDDGGAADGGAARGDADAGPGDTDASDAGAGDAGAIVDDAGTGGDAGSAGFVDAGPPPPPPRSCAEIHSADPSAPTGTYPIDGNGDGAVEDAFCNMDIFGGGWTRVFAYQGGVCPAGFTSSVAGTCGRTTTSSPDPGDAQGFTMAIPVAAFSEVAGTLQALVKGGHTAFGDANARQQRNNVNQIYVDGFSLTLNKPARQHVWTWAIGQGDPTICSFNHCPCRGFIPSANGCSAGNPTSAPGFIGTDFFCEEPSRLLVPPNDLDTGDPVFDGAGLNPACASSPQSGVYFAKAAAGTSADVLELRSLNANNNSTDLANALFSNVDLYVR